ncbi:MAG TPA: DUF4396 domain-containing protein [Gammaproteobacteria bacterium]|nr:DUF4396 domain-containing protein [Gammaproteobacteria bacterium]
MLSGIMLLWFVLTAISVLFVAIDSLRTPESPVLKWGFVLLTAYTGPLGAFLYVLGCREPLPGLHERYTAVLWRQVLGSTMHCVAGDGLGILVGAFIGGIIHLSRPAEIGLEYLLGFGFGWMIFQALFMKASSGGSFYKALKNTFIPELVSMNYLMAAMVVVTSLGMSSIPESGNPLSMTFWFLMSMALLIGFIAAYPINWWLVSNHLKHGMMTVRPKATSGSGDTALEAHATSAHATHSTPMASHDSGAHEDKVTRGSIGVMVIVSFIVLGAGITFALGY